MAEADSFWKVIPIRAADASHEQSQESCFTAEIACELSLSGKRYDSIFPEQECAAEAAFQCTVHLQECRRTFGAACPVYRKSTLSMQVSCILFPLAHSPSL